MKPEVLILDEPVAGLDPAGRAWIFRLLSKLRKERKTTVVLVSHSMDDIAEHTERILVVNDGNIVMDGAPAEVFSYNKELIEMGLDIPQVSRILYMLRENGVDVNTDIVTFRQAITEVARLFGKVR